MLSMNFSKRIHMHNTLRLSEEETEEKEKVMVKDGVHQRTAGEAHLTEMMTTLIMMTLMMIMMMMMTLMMQTKIRDVTYPG